MARLRPSPSLVISILALFVALGGTGYAAARLGKNTVGPRQIKTGAVASSEVKNKSLRTTDLSRAAITALHGKTGATGPQGSTGATGATGAPGPSDAWATALSSGDATLTLPPGSFILDASATATASGATVLTCLWTINAPPEDARSHEITMFPIQNMPAGQQAAVDAPASVTVTGPSNFTASVHCSGGGSLGGMITATKVGTLH
jgi:hypothetical protein